MAKTHVAWRGAIEVSGFPVNVALYARVRRQRNESFRTIAPSGQPMVSNDPIDSGTGQPYNKELSRKGYEVAKGQFVVMPPEAIEKINEGTKTVLAQPAQLVPLETVDLSLAIERYAVRADDKVAGAAQSVQVLWNGLRRSGLAYVSHVAFSNGGVDAVLVLWATDSDLKAALLPFPEEMYEVPAAEFVENDVAGELFERAVGSMYADRMMEAFDHAAFHSEYKARRAEAIQKVIDGEQIEVVSTPEPVPAQPDLMAVLAAAVATEQKKDRPAKKSRKKAAA
jgi:DNA end-binding protein Ku